jgi:hypothetical protein
MSGMRISVELIALSCALRRWSNVAGAALTIIFRRILLNALGFRDVQVTFSIVGARLNCIGDSALML